MEVVKWNDGVVRYSKISALMSALGQTATSPYVCVTAALPLKADICLRRNI
jgi:hypothetical protein